MNCAIGSERFGPSWQNCAPPLNLQQLERRFNRGHRCKLPFTRDERGLKCSLLSVNANGMGAFEFKPGATAAFDRLNSPNWAENSQAGMTSKAVVLGSSNREFRREERLVDWLPWPGGRFIGAPAEQSAGNDANAVLGDGLRREVQRTVSILQLSLLIAAKPSLSRLPESIRRFRAPRSKQCIDRSLRS